MLTKLLFNLQLFGEGGDGGDGGDSAPTGESISGEEVPVGIPDRAKKYYKTAVAKTKAVVSEPQAETKTEETKLSYEDLIKSDDYKEQHKAYMDKTIGDRLKKYKGIEESYGKAIETLNIVAQKYGVNADSEGFLDALKEKIDADDSYYEDYAMEHDISTEDARKMVTMERKLKAMEEQKAQAEKDEQARQQILALQKNAEDTKRKFPEFNLEKEMQDEKFRRLCFVTNGDTTSAYTACHWNDIIHNTATVVSREAQMATANALASNNSRPIENGVKSVAPSVSKTDFRNMSLNELRAYAKEQRLKGR